MDKSENYLLTDTVYLPELLDLPRSYQSSLDASGGALGLAEPFGPDSRVGDSGFSRAIGELVQAGPLRNRFHDGTENLPKLR